MNWLTYCRMGFVLAYILSHVLCTGLHIITGAVYWLTYCHWLARCHMGCVLSYIVSHGRVLTYILSRGLCTGLHIVTWAVYWLNLLAHLLCIGIHIVILATEGRIMWMTCYYCDECVELGII